jgi:hypothetical protein
VKEGERGKGTEGRDYTSTSLKYSQIFRNNCFLRWSLYFSFLNFVLSTHPPFRGFSRSALALVVLVVVLGQIYANQTR